MTSPEFEKKSEKNSSESIYYNADDLWSRNSVFNYVIGTRGDGKTYDAKKRMVKLWLNKHKESIYLRRYKSELKKINTFFDDIAHEFPDHKLEVKNKKFYCDDEFFGFADQLSTFGQVKGATFPNVDLVVYDEFLIEKGSKMLYLSYEGDALMSYCSSIFRKRKGVKMIALGNSTSLINPHFSYWQIVPDLSKRFNSFKNGLITVEKFTATAYAESLEESDFGKLLLMSPYGAMAIRNEFAEEKNSFMGSKPKNAIYFFGCCYQGQDIGFWIDYKNYYIYASTSVDRTQPPFFSMTSNDHSNNTILYLKSADKFYFPRIVASYQNGGLIFENPYIKGLVLSILQTFSIR